MEPAPALATPPAGARSRICCSCCPGCWRGIFRLLRKLAVCVGYTAPMVVLMLPVELPWLIAALAASLALVWVAQARLSPVPAAAGLAVLLTTSEIRSATAGFARARQLGRGSFGVVYAADRLPSLVRVGRCAVKRLETENARGRKALMNEIDVLSMCRHESLLPLLGYCLERGSACLVYPLVTGGSLADRLLRTPEALQRLSRLGVARPSPLSWRELLRILRDTTRALVYLHRPAPGWPKGVVIHRDVKPSNILLDGQLNARLADVGLARQAEELEQGRSHVSSANLVGTPGFIDPLYLNTGRFSQLTDGYAAGMTMLVCLTGRPVLEAMEVAEPMLEDPRTAPDAAASDAGWPDDAAVALAELVVGLSWRRTQRSRMPLAEALSRLEAMADASATRPGLAAMADAAEVRICVVCMAEPRSVRFRCGHCCCCEACTARLECCPSCRAAIVIASRGEALALEDSFVDSVE